MKTQYAERRAERSKAGKRGADARYKKGNNSDGLAMDEPSPAAMATPEMSGAEVRGEEKQKKESIETCDVDLGVEHQKWIKDYEGADTSRRERKL
jgi:hypothetical protein